MDWSYGLLSRSEQTLLRALSVFPGGFTAESVDGLCITVTGEGRNAPREPTMQLLERLVAQSLVVADFLPNGTARYRLLGVIRQYALDRLRAAEEEDEVRRRHATITYVPDAHDRGTRSWHFGSDSDPYRALTPVPSDEGAALARALQSSWLDRLTKEIWHG